MACLYVSTKLHDTLKKPRDILMVSYTVRFPELAARSKVESYRPLSKIVNIYLGLSGLFLKQRSWQDFLGDLLLIGLYAP